MILCQNGRNLLASKNSIPCREAESQRETKSIPSDPLRLGVLCVIIGLYYQYIFTLQGIGRKSIFILSSTYAKFFSVDIRVCTGCSRQISTFMADNGMGDQVEEKVPAEEKVFFKEGSVMVTNARFIVSKHIFAMSGITSIKISKEKLSRKGPFLTILLGVILLYWGGRSWYLCLLDYPWPGYLTLAGVTFFLLGVLWWHARRPIYHIVLTSASGETKPLSDNNRKPVERVIKALNDAIIHRG